MAEVVACLAELQPRAVARNISLIMPYLACNTYAIRSRCAGRSAAAMQQVGGAAAAQPGGERAALQVHKGFGAGR